MSSSVPSQSSINAASTNLTASYLHHIQKGKLIQPFGCLLAIDENNLNVVAFSENAPEMLTMAGDRPALGIGTDVRTIFTDHSASALQKALGFGDVSLLNPTLVHCKSSGKPFYAIVHRAAGSLIVDFEPVEPCEAPVNAPGALQSYKLAAKAIARLQSLPGGGVERLCDAMAREVFELTGYDRVMVHKFHEDDHGEVVAEVAKPGLEPYLGLHYPATDIPQASRSSFLNNSVRMIADRNAKQVKVLQDEKLPFDLTLSGSTMRAPHSCHLQYMANMNCVASLVVAVVVNEGDDVAKDNAESAEPQKRKRLWGLVVCHNTAPRFVPFPLRHACEFLARAFASRVNNKESELGNRAVEKKNILRSQTLLCDMLMRDAPLGVVLADLSPKPINFAPSGGQAVAASLT